MKKHLCTLVMLLLVSMSAFSAEPERSWGMIFQMENLLLSIDSFSDGYQTGVGVKWWATKELALRGLFRLDFNSDAGVTWTEVGGSIGAEYHPVHNEVSPYFGGFVGGQATMDTSSTIAIFFGAMFGVEMRIWKNIGAFAEYDILASIDENGFSIGTYAGGGAQVGLVVYF